MKLFPDVSLEKAPKPTPRKRLWKIVMYVLKFGITILILWAIAAKIDFATALKDIIDYPLQVILAVCGITIIRHWLQYHNWLCALKINPDYRPDPLQVLKSYLIGLPLRFAIPGGHANMAKIFYINNSSRMASLWCTLLERSFLTWACWLFAAGAAILYYPQWPLWLLWLAIAIFLLAPEMLYIVLGTKAKWLPLKKAFGQQGALMIIIQVAATLLTYLQYWLMLRLFVPLDFVESSIRMALIQFSNTIPITISGLGLRESFAIHFLKDTGITAEQAVSTTLCLFIIHDVLPAIVGLWFLVKEKPVLRN